MELRKLGLSEISTTMRSLLNSMNAYILQTWLESKFLMVHPDHMLWYAYQLLAVLRNCTCTASHLKCIVNHLSIGNLPLRCFVKEVASSTWSWVSSSYMILSVNIRKFVDVIFPCKLLCQTTSFSRSGRLSRSRWMSANLRHFSMMAVLCNVFLAQGFIRFWWIFMLLDEKTPWDAISPHCNQVRVIMEEGETILIAIGLESLQGQEEPCVNFVRKVNVSAIHEMIQ